MKIRKCVKPRKVEWVMRDFLAEVSPVTYKKRVIVDDGTSPQRSDFKSGYDYCLAGAEWANNHCKYESVPIIPVMLPLKEDNFCVYLSNIDWGQKIGFGYNFNCLFDGRYHGIRVIMRDMECRASYMKGFSRITKILLHEMGHLATFEEISKNYSKQELRELHENNKRGNYGYVELPDEYAATQWAIDWLANPEHRKLAKEFEKKFWACFKKA